jgi:glutathione S-transferase
VPLLVHDGAVVQESSAILDYIAARLGATKLASKQAADEARALEQELDLAFGLGAQRVLYGALLREREQLTELWSAGGPPWARTFYSLAYPMIAAIVKRMYQTGDPARVAESKDRFRKSFDELDALLERQPYIGGSAPSRVDITAASLLAPLCHPREHRVAWPDEPEQLRSFIDELRDRATWKHVLHMYKEHRAPAGAAD